MLNSHNLSQDILWALVNKARRNDLSDNARLQGFLKTNEVYEAFFSLEGKPPNGQGLGRKVLASLSQLSGALEAHGLACFAMKTFRTYPYTDSDVDLVIIDPAKRKQYIEILRALGYRKVWNSSYLREPGKVFYVQEGEDLASVVPKIHLHSAVSWNGMIFHDASLVWKRLKKEEYDGQAVKVPSLEDELLIMAAHTFFENTYITLGELFHAYNLLQSRNTIETAYMAGVSRRFCWYDALRLYLGFLIWSARQLGIKRLFPELALNELSINDVFLSGESTLDFPVFLPAGSLVKGYWRKLAQDASGLRLRGIPRDIASMAGVIWLFRWKKMKKIRRVTGYA